MPDTLLGGNKVSFARERVEVMARCALGVTLVDAVETIVEDRKLRPSVFLACWGWWLNNSAKWC
jgi:hypothetical protein